MTPSAAEQEQSPKPRRPRRMVVWMIAVPIAILLLALAGANWKFFHLRYAKHLIASDDPAKQDKGIEMVLWTHLRKGMSMEEVRWVVAPAKVAEDDSLFISSLVPLPLRSFTASWEGAGSLGVLGFDENDRLRYIVFIQDYR